MKGPKTLIELGLGLSGFQSFYWLLGFRVYGFADTPNMSGRTLPGLAAPKSKALAFVGRR